MPHELHTLGDHVMDFLPAIIVAMFGAFLQSVRGRWLGWKNFLFSELAAGFGAFIVGELLHAINAPHGMIMFVGGMIGWSGGTLVDHFLDLTRKKIDSQPK